jgi:hypothetical protein
MKTHVLLTVMLFCHLISSSQNLTEVYKKGDVTLTEDATFGSKNNWKELFYDIGATRDQGKDGKNKAIVVAPDGSIFMSHRSRHSISLYDKNGNFVKEFGKKGNKESDFVYMPYVVGILNGKYLATTAADGRMLFFDLNGKWVKTLSLDYMPLENAMLGNEKIAILGHTSWKSKNKKLIAIKDFKSGQEKIIWENLTDQEIARSGRVTFTSGGNPRPKLLASSDGNLLVIFPENGEIRTYSPEGKLLKTFVANTGERLTITQKEREEFYQTAQENIKNMENKLATTKGQAKEDLEKTITEFRQEIKKYLDPAYYPEKLPAISQAMFDSDNNLLLFAFTRERDENRFIVYTFNPEGEKVCESSFVSDKYNLNFSNSRFLFYKGNIIGFQESKDIKLDIPFRLVRFKLTN